jgi:hypothetical protein
VRVISSVPREVVARSITATSSLTHEGDWCDRLSASRVRGSRSIARLVADCGDHRRRHLTVVHVRRGVPAAHPS